MRQLEKKTHVHFVGVLFIIQYKFSILGFCDYHRFLNDKGKLIIAFN